MDGQKRLNIMRRRLLPLLGEDITLTIPDSAITVTFQRRFGFVQIGHVMADRQESSRSEPHWLNNPGNLDGLRDVELDWLDAHVSAIELALKQDFVTLVLSVTPEVSLTALEGKTAQEMCQRSRNTFIQRSEKLISASRRKHPAPPGTDLTFLYKHGDHSITFEDGLTLSDGLDSPARLAAFYRALPTEFLPWLQSVLAYIEGR